MQRRRHRPADDPAAENIENDRQVQEARPSRNVGDISHPKHIRRIRRERTIDQIRRLAATITHCCDRKLAAADTSNARIAHEPRDTVLADLHAVCRKLGMDPRCTIGSARYRVDRAHRLGQRSIRPRPPGGRACPPRIVSRCEEMPSTRHMVAIGNSAWCALTNLNPSTGSHPSPERTRPRLLRGCRAPSSAFGPRWVICAQSHSFDPLTVGPQHSQDRTQS